MSPVHQAPARPCGPSCLCGSDPGSSQHGMEVEAPKAVAWAQGSPREGGAVSFRSSLRSLGTLLRGLGGSLLAQPAGTVSHSQAEWGVLSAPGLCVEIAFPEWSGLGGGTLSG